MSQRPYVVLMEVVSCVQSNGNSSSRNGGGDGRDSCSSSSSMVAVECSSRSSSTSRGSSSAGSSSSCSINSIEVAIPTDPHVVDSTAIKLVLIVPCRIRSGCSDPMELILSYAINWAVNATINENIQLSAFQTYVHTILPSYYIFVVSTQIHRLSPPYRLFI